MTMESAEASDCCAPVDLEPDPSIDQAWTGEQAQRERKAMRRNSCRGNLIRTPLEPTGSAGPYYLTLLCANKTGTGVRVVGSN
jgi:hypothetical protein